MKINMKSKWPIGIFSLLGITASVSAAGNDNCAPTPGAPCYPDESKNCYCLGPENYGVNPPTSPKTCNGDLTMTVAGFYWNAHQSGMEYAIDNHVTLTNIPPTDLSDMNPLNTLTDAEFKTPNFNWDFGFKAGLSYATTSDGWDIGLQWTWYRGKANDHIEREFDDNGVLLPLWSAYAPLQGGILYASDIASQWKLQLNLVDIELGRSFWASKYLSLRPFVGLRIAFLNQDLNLQYKGGSWSANPNTVPAQIAYNNETKLGNDFKGAGLRGGLNTVWNVGSGWGFYGNFALALVYGRFDVALNESNRAALSPHDKVKIAEAKDGFRAIRGSTDLALGIQWQTMFSDCQYGFTFQLGWEHHLFFDQNQLARVTRLGDTFLQSGDSFNITGENIFQQPYGDLDTQGWTLTLRFDF